MNKTYNIVWSYTRQAWVVASELASSVGRPPLAKKRALSAMVLLGIIAGQSVEAAFTPDVSAGQVVTGEVVSGGTQHVSSGGSVTSTIIDDTGSQIVYSGGNVTSTDINSGGHQAVNGGVVTGTNINGGDQSIRGGEVTSTVINAGAQNVILNGSAISTTINSGGDQGISGGGSAISTEINSSGTQTIGGGGSATSTIINGGTQNVNSGGSATQAIVNSDGIQYILGGNATSTIVNSGGRQVISGGNATSIEVNSGGFQTVLGGVVTETNINGGNQSIRGGEVTSTIINAGVQNVTSNGSAMGTTINSGGAQYISSGGSAISTEINSSGTQTIGAGGSATSTIINGGIQDISDGSATWTEINNGGIQHISAGGNAANTTINSGGKQFINSGGNATSTDINSGGLQTVLDGVVTGTNINGGDQSVRGGEVTNTIINAGAQNVILNGSAISTTINSGGVQRISGGGSAISTEINSGGAQTIGDGGSATSSIINDGGVQVISSGGSATDTTVNSGGIQHISFAGVISGATIHSGGQTILWDSAVIAGNVVNAGTLMLSDSTVATSATVSGNVDNSGTMIIGTPAGNAGSVLNIGGDYAGNEGKLMLNSVLGNDSSVTDRLIIGGNATGKTDVTVNNLGGKGDQTVNGIKIIQVGGTSDTGAFYNSNAIRAGLYNYTVIQKGNDFYLTSDLINPTDPTPDKDISTAAGGYIANLAAANQAFVTRLADREGGSEYINPVTGQRDITRLWLRQEGGHNRSRADVLRTTSNRYVAQLGGELINGSFTDTDHWDLGLMAGYVNQQGTTTSLRSNYDVNTKSQLHGYSTGLYGTWYQDTEARTGLYVGTWAQYSWFHNSVNEDGQASDSYKSKGFSASLETGYSWKVIDGERTDFFIQPQAQLVWSGIKADDHYTDTDTRVQGEGGNNLQSSLGVKAYLKGHSELDDNTGRSFKPFVEANWIHNTARYGVRMDGDSLNQDGAKDIVEVKTGVESQLSASTSIWGGVGVQIGDKGYSDTQGQLGLKVRF